MQLYKHWPEGRKRTLLIAASVILARHLDSEKELIGDPSHNLLEKMKGATRIAHRIMKKIDSGYANG
jgi:hypothetical protein